MQRLVWWIKIAGFCLPLALVGACGGGDQTVDKATAGAIPEDGSSEDGRSADYAERMAREHQGDQPVTSPLAQDGLAATDGEREVTYGTVDGVAAQGFLALPEGGAAGAPAVIVIHEWWGLNDNIRAMARKLAAEGFVALAVDLYQGQVADASEGARDLMLESMSRVPAGEENLRQAFAYLKDQGANTVGSIGWCFGGGWSLNAALLLPEQLSAAVIYYGRVKTDKKELAVLTAPVLGIFGAEDRGIPVASVRAFETAMREAGKDLQVHIYPGADHAFANPSGLRYQAEAAADAWAKTLVFLHDKLG